MSTKLSLQQQEEIRKLFNRHKKVSLKVPLDDFFLILNRNLLRFEWGDLFGNYTPAEKIREPINYLTQDIDKILSNTDIVMALDEAMAGLYPCPKWESSRDAIYSSGADSAIIRPSESGFEIVHAHELLTRIRAAAETIKTRSKGDKSREREYVFIRIAAELFKMATGQTAKQTKAGIFDHFLIILLEPFGGKNESYSSAIRRALT